MIISNSSRDISGTNIHDRQHKTTDGKKIRQNYTSKSYWLNARSVEFPNCFRVREVMLICTA